MASWIEVNPWDRASFIVLLNNWFIRSSVHSGVGMRAMALSTNTPDARASQILCNRLMKIQEVTSWLTLGVPNNESAFNVVRKLSHQI